MTCTGLLVVSNVKQFKKNLTAVRKYVNSLYIHLNIPPAKVEPIPSWGRLISLLYEDTNLCCSEIDMRILVAPLKEFNRIDELRLKPVDIIFSDSYTPEICQTFSNKLNVLTKPIFLQTSSNSDIVEHQSQQNANKKYDTVVLGGTFDRIHIGHKIFLSQAVLRACRRLVVGVTTSQLNKSKTLSELILPVEQRISEVKEFLMEIDSSLCYDVVPIDDPFGPTKTDPNMDLIVVSEETLRGGQKVNEIRQQTNLKSLDIFCINVVEGSVPEGPKESKISSSNTRIDLLGTRLKSPKPRPHLPSKPYIIGLIGGIASGKSKMAEVLRELGAIVYDCDKIAHELYEPGQVCFERVVQHFGNNVLNADGRIDRKKLGFIVFSNPQELEILNGIIWPELLLELKRRIEKVRNERKARVVVIEAAVLLKAGWEAECHEIWSMVIPTAEAVRRLKERNHLSEEEAHIRLKNQPENDQIVSKSNVVFSSQWTTDFTKKQAEKAWKVLMDELM